MALTPEILRTAADLLSVDAMHHPEFMCHAVARALRKGDLTFSQLSNAGGEFLALLEQQGVDTSGALCDEQGVALRHYLDEDSFAIQCVRFDFLNLLAHSLES